MARQRCTAASRQQPEPIVQAQGNLLEPKSGSARRRKLDGEWDAVEMPADRGDRRKVLSVRREVRTQRLRPVDEKLHGTVLKDTARLLRMLGRYPEGRNAIDEFTLDPQDLSACGENGRARTEARERFREAGRRVDDVFAIIENKEKFPSADRASDGLRGNLVPAQLQAEDACDGGRHQTGIRQRGQLNKPTVTLKIWQQAAGNLQRQRGLPDPTRPGQRDCPIGGEKIPQVLQGG